MDPHPTPPMGIRPVGPSSPVYWSGVLAGLLADALPYVRVRRLAGDTAAALLCERIEGAIRAVNSAEIHSSQNETNRAD